MHHGGRIVGVRTVDVEFTPNNQLYNPYPRQGQVQPNVKGAPLSKAPYNAMLDTPEPPGGQVQNQLKPLGSAVKGGGQKPGAVYVSNENESDEIAGHSAEGADDDVDRDNRAREIKTLADLNRYNREMFGRRRPPTARTGDRIRSLKDMNRFNRARPDAQKRRQA
jgi:hypothetical protein